jgi:hypothetical protein
MADVDHDVNPDILTGGIVTPAEVEKLFKVYVRLHAYLERRLNFSCSAILTI